MIRKITLSVLIIGMICSLFLASGCTVKPTGLTNSTKESKVDDKYIQPTKFDREGDLYIQALKLQDFPKVVAKSALKTNYPGFYNVLDFGAIPDDNTDDTEAIQKALKIAGMIKGVVFIPAGDYIITAKFEVPAGTTLTGEFISPEDKEKCTTLMVYYEDKTEDDGPFINLYGSLDHIRIYYPLQSKESVKPYDWTIRSSPDNKIQDVFLVNSYKGIDYLTYGSGRHYVENLYGQPLMQGMDIDKCLDVPRMTNINFKPYWSKYLRDYTIKNATAITFRRTDWEMVNQVYIEGYKTAIEFEKGYQGSSNVLMNGVTTKDCVTSLLITNSMLHQGIHIANSSLQGQVVIGRGNMGNVKVTNTVFDGQGKTDVLIKAEGSTTLTIFDSEFKNWGVDGKGFAISTNCYNLIVSRSKFIDAVSTEKQHIEIRSNMKSCISKQNTYAGNKCVYTKKGTADLFVD